MTRKKPIRRVATEYVEPDEPRIENETDAAEDTYDAYVGQFGQDGVVVKVYRKTAAGKEYCFFGAPSEIDEEQIRLYHAKQSYAHEPGLYFLNIIVHGELRNSFPLPISPQISTPGTPTGGGSMEYIVRLLQEQNTRLEARLLAQQPQREPLSALADVALRMAELKGNGGAGMDTFIKGVEFGQSMGGGGDDWKSALAGLAHQALPLISGALTSAGQRANPVPAPTAALPQNGDSMEAQLRLAIGYLKGKCLQGKDPGLYIDWILDNADQAIYAELIRRILQDDLQAFIAVDSEIGQPQYRTFFQSIHDGIRSEFSAADPVANDTGRITGDAGDTASDGKSRKGSVKKSKLS